MPFQKITTCLVSMTLVLVALPGSLRADSFDRVLVQEHAPRLYALLDKAGYKSVGFLNFSLRRESIDTAPSFQSAPMTRVLPARLQNALLLYSATKFGNEIQVLADPSAVAGDKGITSYSGPGDRARLFGLTYPVFSLNSQAASVKPDAFIIGEITLSADKQKTTVAMKVIDANSADQPRPLYEFTVPTDLSILAESGVSFSLQSRDARLTKTARPPHQRSNPDRVLVTSDTLVAKDTTETKTPAGVLDSSCVDFQVMYDSALQPVQRDSQDKAKYVVTPVKPGQRITFKLKNISDEKIGVAVLINKKNILYGEDIEARDPRRLSKFILTPGMEQTIDGLMDIEGSGNQANIVRELRGLSQQETAEAAKELGRSNFCGYITLYVFREGTGSVSHSTIGGDSNSTPKPPSPPAANGSSGSTNGLRNPSNRLSWIGAGNLESLFKESDEVAKARDVLIGVRGTGEKVETREDRLKDPEYAEAFHIRYWQQPSSKSPIVIGR